MELCTVQRFEFHRTLGVIPGKVDRFRNLWIGLFNRFASLRHGDFDELSAVFLERVRNHSENMRAVLGGPAAPRPPALSGRGKHTLEALRVAHSGCGDIVDPELRLPRPAHNFCSPLPVCRHGGVGVGRIVERVPVNAVTNRGAMRCWDGVVECANGFSESFGFPREIVVFGQEKHGGHEVVLVRAFVETANQVRDGNIEFRGVNDRRVEQQASRRRTDRLGLAFGHPEEHLEFDAVTHFPPSRESPRECDVEQIVTRHANFHVGNAGGGERVVEDTFVVGVRFPFGTNGRQFPAVDLGVDAFHRQVRTLDNSNLDRRTTTGTSRTGPILESNHRVERIRQIRLQNDSRLEAEEFVAIEDVPEYRDCQVEVVVFLHVQVDELAGLRLRGTSIEGQQFLDDVCHRLTERPGRMGRNNRGNFDGHIIDVGAIEEVECSLQSLGGFIGTENGLAQQVDVEVDPARAQCAQLSAEPFRGRVDDEVAHHSPQGAACNGDDKPGHETRGEATESDENSKKDRQKSRDNAGECAQVPGRDTNRLGSHDTVDKTDRKRQTVRVAQDAGKTFRCA